METAAQMNLIQSPLLTILQIQIHLISTLYSILIHHSCRFLAAMISANRARSRHWKEVVIFHSVFQIVVFRDVPILTAQDETTGTWKFLVHLICHLSNSAAIRSSRIL